MKIVLSIVIVLLLGLCGWVRYTSTRPTEAHRSIISGLKVELKESRAEFDAANEALATAKSENENLRRRVASLETAAVARSFPGEGNSGTAPPAAASSAAPSPSQSIAPSPSRSAAPPPTGGWTIETRLSELQMTFDSHRHGIESRKNLLEDDLAALRAKRKAVENTEFYFSEQTPRVDLDGNVTGNRGVRTSSADRDRAKGKVADQAAEVDLEIARKQTEIAKTVREMESLRENYSKALVRIREEFGLSGDRAAGN